MQHSEQPTHSLDLGFCFDAATRRKCSPSKSAWSIFHLEVAFQRHVLEPVFLRLKLYIVFVQVNKQLRAAQSQVSCHVVPTVRLQFVSILTVENIFQIFSQMILVCIGDGILMLDLVRLTLGFVSLEHGIQDNVRIPEGSVVAKIEWSLSAVSFR